MGEDDVQPKDGAGQFWIVLESILGYIMLGGLISILAINLPVGVKGGLGLLATYQPTLSAGPARGWQSSLGLAE